MAWQIKVRMTGQPAASDIGLSAEAKSLFDTAKSEGIIVSQDREVIDENTKVDTIVFRNKADYDTYRANIDSLIGGDEPKFSAHTVEVIEQVEV